RRLSLRASSCFVERLPPADAVADDMQETTRSGQVVGVAWLDRFPRIAVGVGCRKVEHCHEPGLAVGPVVGECLAGPLARDEDTASGVAEVVGAVCLALAAAGH